MLNDIFNILIPQICLGGFIILLLFLSMFISPRYYKYARLVSLVGIFLTTLSLSFVQTEPQYFALSNSIMSDSYTLLFHFLILGCGFLVAVLNRALVKESLQNAYTFYSILLCAIFGAMNVVSANDFLTLFVSVELLSFSTYFLISAYKGYASKEATFKYLITSAISSGVFLFGVSYIYGTCGSINLSEIYEIITLNGHSLVYTISSILVVLGLISKLAIFPFANWVIDVYKGCETSILAFISTVPKLAIFGILCRLLVFSIGNSVELPLVIAIISLITAFWANTYAVKENNVKAILACSSAANASYMLMAVALVSVYNLSAVIFYLICYVFMNISVFAFLNIYGDKNNMDVTNFKGYFYKYPILTIFYVFSVLSLAGIPITSGFVSKIYLLSAIASSGLIFLPFLIVLVVLMVVALFYYLKIIIPFFNQSNQMDETKNLDMVFSQKFILFFTATITLLMGVFPEKIIELCRLIAYNI